MIAFFVSVFECGRGGVVRVDYQEASWRAAVCFVDCRVVIVQICLPSINENMAALAFDYIDYSSVLSASTGNNLYGAK